jgi:hypothetical protein
MQHGPRLGGNCLDVREASRSDRHIDDEILGIVGALGERPQSIPQMGQLPGIGCRICGCFRQV